MISAQPVDGKTMIRLNPSTSDVFLQLNPLLYFPSVVGHGAETGSANIAHDLANVRIAVGHIRHSHEPADDAIQHAYEKVSESTDVLHDAVDHITQADKEDARHPHIPILASGGRHAARSFRLTLARLRGRI